MTNDTINDTQTIAGNAEGNPSAEKGTPMDKSIGNAPTMRPKDERGGRGAFIPGDVIARRYVVERMLGEGGMGIVYQCLDRVGGVSVAVKCLPPDVSRNADEMEDIRANYRLVADLHHQNIAGARTLELDESTGDYYLVMDLARGMSLKRWMRRNPQATTEAKLAILRQVAAALDYAHVQKVIHRDVKPENVMVDDEGGVKVLDFGLAAQIRSSQSRTSNAVTSRGGTPGYKSPEQWRGKPQREAADVYSFGVMAYWMFAGALPFDGDDLAVLGHAVLTEPVEPIAGLPAHMNAALMKALAKKPDERFASCGEFMDALEGKDSFSRVEHVERVDDLGGARRLAEPGGPRPVAAVKGILAAALIAALAGGAWWLASGRNGTPETNGTTGTNVVHVSSVSSVPSVSSVSSVSSVPSASSKAPARTVPAPAPKPARSEIGVHGKVQLWEGGPYWAETNIGAEKPEDYGYYFWWGDTVGYKRVNDAWVASDGSSSNFSFDTANTPTFGKDSSRLRAGRWITAEGVLAPKHNAAHMQWGGEWRMPTKQELDDLSNNCDWEWTTLNGVKGYCVRGRGAYASASIFLPCAGYGYGTSLYSFGSHGYYWSSVPYSGSYYSWYLDFNSGDHSTDSDGYRDYGFSVRPVQGFAK